MAINIDAFKNAKDHGEELYATHSSARAVHKKIDEMIEEESHKLKNRKYQAKHRYFEQITKGMRIVED